MTLLFIYRMIHNVLVSASTSGYYGDRVDEMLAEELGGTTQIAEEFEIRVVKFEDRYVLSSSGGTLKNSSPLQTGLWWTNREWLSVYELDWAR
jgi:NAD dependent epimerase/dehydratase family enzyme